MLLDELNKLDTRDIHLVQNDIHIARISKYPKLPTETLLELYATVHDIVDRLHVEGSKKRKS